MPIYIGMTGEVDRESNITNSHAELVSAPHLLSKPADYLCFIHLTCGMPIFIGMTGLGERLNMHQQKSRYINAPASKYECVY